MSLIINKVVLHILDKNLGVPVISENIMNDNNAITMYLEKHVLKCLHDPDLKRIKLDQNSDSVKIIQNFKHNNDFLEVSQIIANKFYEIIMKYDALNSCDLVVVEFQYNNDTYLAAIIMNYKKGYMHFTKNENGIENYLIEQQCLLPSSTQKIDEFIIFEINTLYVNIKEKKMNLNGEYSYYISKHILKCKTEMADKEKVKIISETANKLITEHCDDNVLLKGSVNRIIKENIEDSLKIDINEISDNVFKSDEIKHLYKEEVIKQGIDNDEVKINYNYANKLKSKQKIITSEGIEINIPFSVLNDKDKIDFITNNDGTTSILLKNIDKMINK